MNRILAVIPLLLILIYAGSAEAATYSESPEPTWHSAAGLEEAAQVMGVSSAQAEEDLAVQHEATPTIEKLMQAGDDVWFNNNTATIHVYHPPKAASAAVLIPTSVAPHIVQDATPRARLATGPGPIAKAASCSYKEGEEWDYCTPLKAGQNILKINGQDEVECTEGFMVRDYSGNTYFLTAGHCALWGTTVYSNSFEVFTWPGLALCWVGSSVRDSAPWGGHDSAITSVNSCGGVLPEMHNFSTGGNTSQTGATNTPFVGEYVCHWGAASNHHCGTELEVNVPSVISYESGNWTIDSTDVVCGYAHAGDSGGPVTDGTYTGDATGIILADGESSACADSYIWVEERIFSALGIWGVYVVSA